MTIRFLTAASLLALVSACSSQPGPSASNPLDTGEAAFAAGDFGTAEAAYDGALRADPSSSAAKLGLAEVYEQTGRTQEAASLYREIVAASSGTIRVWPAGVRPQDGVTEVAMRRLGQMTGIAVVSPGYAPPYSQPAEAAPVYTIESSVGQPAATEPMPGSAVQTYVQPETVVSTPPAPVYDAAPAPALDPFGGFSERPAAYQAGRVQPATYAPAPVIEEYAAPTAYEATETVQPISYAPAPIVEEYAAPDVDDWADSARAYVLDAEGNVSYGDLLPDQPEVAPIYEYDESVLEEVPAPYEPAEPFSYAPAEPMPMTYAAPEATATPGYTVVDGDIVYIGSDDIAPGASVPSQPGYATESYGVPQQNGAPDTYIAPRDLGTIDGIPMIEVN